MGLEFGRLVSSFVAKSKLELVAPALDVIRVAMNGCAAHACISGHPGQQ